MCALIRPGGDRPNTAPVPFSAFVWREPVAFPLHGGTVVLGPVMGISTASPECPGVSAPSGVRFSCSGASSTLSGMALGFCQIMSDRRYQPSARRAKASSHGIPSGLPGKSLRGSQCTAPAYLRARSVRPLHSLSASSRAVRLCRCCSSPGVFSVLPARRSL